MRLKRYLLPALVTFGVLAAFAALAATGNFGLDTAAGGTGIPTGTSIPQLIGNILKTVLGFVATLFLLLMVYAGFLYMTARGDEKKVGEAKKMITGAIIGVLIIASAYAITSFVLGAVSGTGNTTSTPPTTPSTIGTKQKGDPCTSGSDCAPPNICDIGGTNKCI